MESQPVTKHLVHNGLVLVHGNVALAYHDGRSPAVGAGLQDGVHVRVGYLVPADGVVADETESSVSGDVAVDEPGYLSQIGDESHGAARGDVYFHAIGFGPAQGVHRGGRYAVGLEAHQCAVDVEKQCFNSHLRMVFVIQEHPAFLNRS